MSNFEIVTSILSSLAILISLSALIVSIIKIKNEKKENKKQFIINNLTQIRDKLSKELTELDILDPTISMGLIFRRIEAGENFDYYSEILKLYNTISTTITNALIILRSCKTTKCSSRTYDILKSIFEDVSNCLKIVKNQKNRQSIVKEYSNYIKNLNRKSYDDYKFGILIELTNTINHFIKDDLNKKEIDEFFIQLEFRDSAQY